MIISIIKGYTVVDEIISVTSYLGAQEWKMKELNYFTQKDIDRWARNK